MLQHFCNTSALSLIGCLMHLFIHYLLMFGQQKKILFFLNSSVLLQNLPKHLVLYLYYIVPSLEVSYSIHGGLCAVLGVLSPNILGSFSYLKGHIPFLQSKFLLTERGEFFFTNSFFLHLNGLLSSWRALSWSLKTLCFSQKAKISSWRAFLFNANAHSYPSYPLRDLISSLRALFCWQAFCCFSRFFVSSEESLCFLWRILFCSQRTLFCLWTLRFSWQ